MIDANSQSAGICGDGLCDLAIESYENCSEDCIYEKNSQPTGEEGAYVPYDVEVLPGFLQRDFGDFVFLVPAVFFVILFFTLLVLKVKIVGKTLKEYLWPIKYYVCGAVLTVVLQYVVALPLTDQYPFFLNLTQALWVLMVVFSVIKLVKIHDKFNMGNVVILGILYSFIIHGLKISIRYFFYDKPVWYLMDRFLYGSILVMITALVVGFTFIYTKNKK